MNAAAAIALIATVIEKLPAAIATGEQVIALVNRSYERLKEAVGDREVTPAEISDLVAGIVANSEEIQSIS